MTELKESETHLREIKQLMDGYSLKGGIVSQGLFRKPLYIKGVSPPEEIVECYTAELKHYRKLLLVNK